MSNESKEDYYKEEKYSSLVSVAKRCKIKHIKAPVRSFSDPPLVEECHFNTDDSSDQILDENNEGTCYDDQPDTEQQTAHTNRKQKAAEKWQIVQSVALNGVIMNMSEPLLDCTICDKSRGIVKCDQCGPLMIYCKQCAIDMHQHSLFHHFVEVWEVDIETCLVIYLYNINVPIGWLFSAT